jgi:hypothetical protein
MNTAQRAIEYRKRGWFPIPVPQRSKVPPIEGWQTLRLEISEIPKYFPGPMNIGILTGSVSKNLVDVDLDTQHAIRLAPRFLPSTLTFGRPSKPLSHWVYTAYGARTEIFVTPQKLYGSRERDGQRIKTKTLVELRADGKQTIFPNSIHECGEQILWSCDIEEQQPSEIKAGALRVAVAKLATSCLLIEFGWAEEDAMGFANQPEPEALIPLPPEVQALAARWLGTAAPQGARPAPTKPPVSTTKALDDSFEVAVVRWNAAHPITFTKRNTGPCPVCGDTKSFGWLRDNSDKWSCFSTDHPDDVGKHDPSQSCFWGDALDLEAFRCNKTRAQVLREDGFLKTHLKIVSDRTESEYPEAVLQEQRPLPPSDPATSTLSGAPDEPTPPSPPSPPDDTEDNRPFVRLTPEIHDVVDQTIAALLTSEDVFQRGSHLVRVTTAVRSPMHTKLFGPTPSIEPLSNATLTEYITRTAKIFKYNERKKKWDHAVPPDKLVNIILDRGNWRGMRPLEGIVEVPTVRLDGTILDTPGYDEQTGLIYQPSVAFDPIKRQPTKQDAQQAIAELLDLACDFPFAAPSALYKAAWLSALLTPFVRTSIPTAPMFLVDSNIRGSGKSKLCDIIAIIATGRPMPRTINPHHDEEFKKLVTSLAIAGSTLVMIDNITGSLGSQALDAVLTAATWKDRILGKSEMTREIPLSTIWFGTGNNVELKGDLCRRTIHIRLKTNDEAPETRQNFKYKDLLETVQERRSRFAACALTILRAYVAAGSPPQTLRAMDFREWSNVVRGAVVWAGMADPAETQVELAQADGDRSALSLFLNALEAFPNAVLSGFTTASLLRMATCGGDASERLRESVIELCPTRDMKLPSAGSLGKRLAALRGRVVEGCAVDKDAEIGGSVRWKLVRVTTVGGG